MQIKYFLDMKKLKEFTNTLALQEIKKNQAKEKLY